MARWAQLGEYTQPGPDEEGVPLDILDKTLAWGASRTTTTEAFNFEDNLVSMIAFGTEFTLTFVIVWRLDVQRYDGLRQRFQP